MRVSVLTLILISTVLGQWKQKVNLSNKARFERALLASYLRAQNLQFRQGDFNLNQYQKKDMHALRCDNGIYLQECGKQGEVNTSTKNKLGIYASEFLGSSIFASPGVIYLVYGMASTHYEVPLDSPLLWTCILGNSLITSCGTCLSGKIVGEHGSLGKSAIGAGVGTITGCLITLQQAKKDPSNGLKYVLILITMTSLGAIIGYNL